MLSLPDVVVSDVVVDPLVVVSVLVLLPVVVVSEVVVESASKQKHMRLKAVSNMTSKKYRSANGFARYKIQSLWQGTINMVNLDRD